MTPPNLLTTSPFLVEDNPVIPHYEIQYLQLCAEVAFRGSWTMNKRTKERTKAVIGRTFKFDVANDPVPAITTRQAPVKMPIAEILGYLKGLDNADDFAALGAKTWYANANETEAWLKNPNRKGKNDLGRIYGVQGRSWMKPNGDIVDQFDKLVSNLKRGIDDRGEILTFYNPGEFDKGCLRPCLHTHQFSLLDDTLYLDSMQRSADLPLGTVANMQQVYFLLKLVSQMVGAKPGIAKLHMSNCHIYESQLELMVNKQLQRNPYTNVEPQLIIDPSVKSVSDIDRMKDTSAFKVVGYDQFHDKIEYPFAA